MRIVPVQPLRAGLPTFLRASHPTIPLPLLHGERKGAGGKVRALGVRRSTGPETVETLFQRVAEPHALRSNAPYQKDQGNII